MKKPSLFVLIDIKEKFLLIPAPDSPETFWYHKRRRRNDFQKKIDVHQQITQAYR